MSFKRIATIVLVLLAGLLPVAGPAAATVIVPFTTPAAAVRIAYSGGSTACESGHGCAYLYTDKGALNYIFKFYAYGTYRLSYFGNPGVARNSQTGGATMRVLDVNGGEIVCVPAGQSRAVDWDPAWYIRLTTARC